MTEATALADSIEQTLGPLALEANRAFWDANVDASEENERRQAETLLAYSSTLGDAELFADVDAARRNGRHDRLHLKRSSRCLERGQV